MRRSWFIFTVCLMGLFVMPHIVHAQQVITGPWLWMVAPTDANQGGQASTDIDSLDKASGGKVKEADVAKNGAKKGDKLETWTGLKRNFQPPAATISRT